MLASKAEAAAESETRPVLIEGISIRRDPPHQASLANASRFM